MRAPKRTPDGISRRILNLPGIVVETVEQMQTRI
jgi:hypothetical protein